MYSFPFTCDSFDLINRTPGLSSPASFRYQALDLYDVKNGASGSFGRVQVLQDVSGIMLRLYVTFFVTGNGVLSVFGYNSKIQCLWAYSKFDSTIIYVFIVDF